MVRYRKRKKEPRVKQLVDKLLYDTDKSKSLHMWQNGFDYNTAYISPRGRYFLAVAPPQGAPYVYPLSKEDLMLRLSYDGQHDALLKLFGDEIEEA